MSSKLWLTGGIVLSLDPNDTIIDNGIVEVQDGNIVAIHKDAVTPPSDAKVIDCTNCIVMPGLVNTHNHLAMSLLRGVADDLPLDDWLINKIIPLEQKCVNPEFVYFGSLLAMLEMTRFGVTCFNDMYYFEKQVARASKESGIRGVCGQTIVEISETEDISATLDASLESFMQSLEEFPLVRPSVAPHSIYGVKEKTLKKCIDFAEKHNLLLHIHVSEVQSEVDNAQKAYGQSPVEKLSALGMWDRVDVLAAHMVCLSEKDIEIVGKAKAGISHNIESNLKLGTEISPVAQLIAAGARVGLGTDGVASNNNVDILQEVDTAAKTQAYKYASGALTTKQAVRMITIEGAHALGMGDIIGSLEVGKKADIIAVDINQPHLVPMYDAYSHLTYSASGKDVKHTIVDGKVLMESYQVKCVDEAQILNEARQWGKKIQQI